MNVAYAAGFDSEETLLPAVAIAVSESELWTSARNWKPEWGFRDGDEPITIAGPADVWTPGKRQMHSDRGLWQVASRWWPEYPDCFVDDPMASARFVYRISEQGTNFDHWDSFVSGHAQKHYDESFEGWPALPPLVLQLLESVRPPHD
jgi:hypothetical protein